MPPSTLRALAYQKTTRTHDLATAMSELRECVTLFDHALTILNTTHPPDLRIQASATAQRLATMASILERSYPVGGAR